QRDTGGSRQKRKAREHEPGPVSTPRQSRKFTAVDVNEHQRRVTSYAIANAQAEAAAQILSSQDRKYTQSQSTRKFYARLQAHWI
ncbi:hypothetical protein BGX27_005674, partial [Mortierella sp. AM989]